MNKNYTYKDGFITQKPEMEKPDKKYFPFVTEFEYAMSVYSEHLSTLTHYAAPASLWEKEGIKKDDLVENVDFKIEWHYMGMYSKKGTKVTPVYKDGNPFGGYEYDQEKVRQYLKEGEWYTVESTEVHSWSSTVKLKEVSEVSFNTVSFYSKQIAEPIVALTPAPKMSKEDAIDKITDILLEPNHVNCHNAYHRAKRIYEAMESLSDSRVKELEEEVADYKEVNEDHKRLVRELDVMLNGEGAAKQASLCDIVSQVRSDSTKFQESNTVIAMQQQEIERLKGLIVDLSRNEGRMFPF